MSTRLKWDRKRQPEAPPDRSATPVDFLAAQHRPRRKRPAKPTTYAGPRLKEKIADVCAWLGEN